MKKCISPILKLSISAGLLFYIFKIIPFSEVIATITSSKLSYLILSLLILFIVTYIQVSVFKVLTDKQQMRLSITQIFQIRLIIRFCQLFLPGSLVRGPLHWQKLSRSSSKPAEALAPLSFSRLIETILIVVLGISLEDY